MIPSLIQVEAEVARRGLDEKAIPDPDDGLPLAVARADRLEPQLRRRFLAAIAQVKDKVSLAELEAAARSGNQAAIFEALHQIELDGALRPGLTDTLKSGYLTGAQAGAEILEQAGVRVRFDRMDAHAIQWATNHAGRLIVEIDRVQRIAVQEILADALRSGRTVDQLARDLRNVVGLHGRQARQVVALRGELLEAGVAPEIIDLRAAKFSQGLLNQRARVIARSEIVQASHHGQRGQWDEAARDGLFNPKTTQREWLTTIDDLTDTDICLPMDGMRVGYGEAWTLPDGSRVDIPSLSHPQCRCSEGLLFNE